MKIFKALHSLGQHFCHSGPPPFQGGRFDPLLCLTAETLRVSAFLGCGRTSLAMLAQPDAFCGDLYSLAMLAQPDAFSGGLYSLAMLAQPDAFSGGLYSLAMLAQPDRGTEPSLCPEARVRYSRDRSRGPNTSDHESPSGSPQV